MNDLPYARESTPPDAWREVMIRPFNRYAVLFGIACMICGLKVSLATGTMSIAAHANTTRNAGLRGNVPLSAHKPGAPPQYIFVGEDFPGLAVFNAVTGALEVSLPNHRTVDSLATNSAGDVYATGDSRQFHSINTFTARLKEISPTIKMASPAAIAVGGNGNIYVSTITYQKGSQIHTYTPQGVPTSPTIANIAAHGLAVDGNNKVYALTMSRDGQNMAVLTFLPDGTPTTPTIQINGCYPGGTSTATLAVDSAGKIYVSAICHSKNFFGILTFLPNGSQTSPSISAPDSLAGMTVDSAGKIYILGNSTITTFLPDGTQTTPTITGLGGLYAISVY